MDKSATKTWMFVLGFALVFQSLGCGTLMYPERRGQRGGDIDVGVAILDGVGLLFFLIPGIIAYAVDFSNGTIYFPAGHHRRHEAWNMNDLEKVSFDPKGDVKAEIERILRERTGVSVKLDRENARVFEVKSEKELLARFAEQPDAAFAAR
jgi:hypothetical protein